LWSGFSAFTTGQPSEIWIRPNWEAALLFPATFPAPKPTPSIDPHQLELKARREEMISAKQKVRRQWESRGYTFDARRRSWSPPAGR
jgi:hypothetical protein